MGSCRGSAWRGKCLRAYTERGRLGSIDMRNSDGWTRNVRTTGKVVLLMASLSCGAPPVDTSWHNESWGRWRALDVRSARSPGFSQLDSAATGVTHANVVDDEHALANRNLIIGAGVALGDVDGDGLADLFLASVERPAALYHNDGGFRFSDVTAASGIATASLATTGATFGDVDGDNDLDLLAGTLGGPLKLWLNDGKGKFSDAGAAAGLDSGFAATTLTLADVDGDGDLDLYVATYKTRNALDAIPPQQRSFEQVVKKVGDKYVVLTEWQKEYRIEDRPDLGGIVRSQRAERDLFYMNDGKGRFTPSAVSGLRFRDETGRPLASEPDFFTLAARFYDFTGDGAPDLYVCNDFEDPDQVWVNDGAGNFRMLPQLAIRQTSNTCMSVDFADVNRDGAVDFFTADMLSRTLAQRQRQIATHTPLPKKGGIDPAREQWMRNTLQIGRGDGTFAQVADMAGVAASDWSWGAAFVDADLDGWEDLLVAAGHRWDVRDADTFERIRNSFPRVAWNREQGEFPLLAAHNVAYRNRGDLTFEDAGAAWKFGTDSAVSNGLALADFDGDGDLDAIATRLNAPPAIYRNEAKAPRIAVRLRGRAPNTGGVGALVTVRAKGLPAQSREVTAGGLYLSGSEGLLSFAAGDDSAPTIEVRWRDGGRDSVTAAPNRLYEISQPASRDARLTSRPSALGFQSSPIFVDVTGMLGGHTHVDSLFDDYRRQPLLPNRFSQLGPGVTWFDADGDGKDDLLVGTGRGGKLTMLHNEGARFSKREATGAAAPWDLTTLLPVSNGKGAFELFFGQSNYEIKKPEDAKMVVPLLAIDLPSLAPRHSSAGTPRDTSLDKPLDASVGPLALGDLNGDGRPDLFIGARVVAGAWPLPAASRILLRTAEGSWINDTTNTAVLRGLGLVTAALWTDLNGDGWSELVVTSELGPVRILQNIRGALRDISRELGLADRSSRWNGLNAGDFDGDGLMDLVVTSWGRNLPWQASAERPHELMVGRFPGNALGLLPVTRDPKSRQLVPLESFSRLGVAMPDVRTRIPTYAQFSRSTANEILGGAAKAAQIVGATTYDHGVLLNRGVSFDWIPLPASAQVAPAFAPVVADFNGDGKEDLFLSQNFSATEIGLPRFNAGLGQLLLGDGKGGFSAEPAMRSGIRIVGDGRGAATADFDGDGRSDIAVAQNGGATTLWRNTLATPGLRVRADAGAWNPLGAGVQLRVVYADSTQGPSREIHLGGGYWSSDSPTMVMATPKPASAVWVRWPGGKVDTLPVARDTRDGVLVIRASGAGAPTSSR
jgi:hypothetical protein